jgi:hypothetical protein
MVEAAELLQRMAAAYLRLAVAEHPLAEHAQPHYACTRDFIGDNFSGDNFSGDNFSPKSAAAMPPHSPAKLGSAYFFVLPVVLGGMMISSTSRSFGLINNTSLFASLA